MDCEEIFELINNNKTYHEISVMYQQRYPGHKGFSIRNIKRYVKLNNLRPVICNDDLKALVDKSIKEVITSFYL